MDENPKDGNQETQEPQDEASTNEALAAIKAQLQEAGKAKTALEQAAERDAKLMADLETALSEAKQGSEASTAELAAVKDARDQAVAKYATMAKALNPTIPEDMISGETIADIDASVEKAKGLVAAVKKTMETEASAAKVPAGAPTRGETTEGMTPREKIAAGTQQKR